MKVGKGTNSFRNNRLTADERTAIANRAGLQIKGGQVVLDANYRIHPQSCACTICAVPGFWTDWLHSVIRYYKANLDCIDTSENPNKPHFEQCADVDGSSCNQQRQVQRWLHAFLAEKCPEDYALYKLMRTATLRRAYQEGNFELLHKKYTDIITSNYDISFKSQEMNKGVYSSTSKGYKEKSPFAELKKLKLAS